MKDYSTNKTRRVILEAGAKLDVNGTESYYHVVLGEGATIANSGDAVDTGWRALPHVELAGDAFFDATSQIVMQKGNIDSGGTYKLDLNGYTLTKTGSNNAVLINVGIGAGTVKVQDGGFKLSSGVTLDTITGVNFSLVGNAQKTGTLITDVVATAKDVTFDGGMVQVGSNKSLTATGKTMVKSAGGTLSGSMIAHNQVSMEEGAALKVGTSAAAGSLKVQSATDSGKYVTISGAANTSASVTAKSDSALIQMAQDASFTIADMTLTNTSISAAETTTRVNLSNVSVAENSVATLAKGAFAVQNQATVGTGGGEVDFTTSSYSGFTLGSAESAASITLNLGDLSQVKRMGPGVYESITILLDGFQMTEGNASIFFAADSWLGQLLSSQGANAYVSGSLDAPASVSEGGSSVSVSYSAATGDNVGTIITITGLNVPEPTTSTLSLLALAALAARRRRK